MSQLRLPHFIIGGAPRSGTTWLWALANRHPEIGIAQSLSPEPKFFLIDDLYERGLQYYSQTWFDPLPQRRLYGEKTTNYFENPLVPERIKNALPAVKLIFMLRNPVDRAYSNYLWSKQNGLETETFQRALALETERESAYTPAHRFSRPFSFFSRGLYAQYLERFHAHFAKEQILVLRAEDVALRASLIAEQFFAFLGLEPTVDATELGIINAVTDKATPLDAAVRKSLIDRYREPNRHLAKMLGPEFELWEEFR